MIGGFQYDITLGPYQQERLHAMAGTFVIHNNFGALSAAVMTGHYMDDCSTTSTYITLWPNQQE